MLAREDDITRTISIFTPFYAACLELDALEWAIPVFFEAEHAKSCGFLTDVCASDDWPALVTQAAADAAVLDDDSRRALLQQSRDDRHLDQDMAALVRSASRPGLAQRIAGYLASLK